MPARSPQALAKRKRYNAAYQKRHAKRLTVYRRQWQRDRLSTPQGRVEQLVRGARRRAKSLGREFAITASDLSVPLTCPILGIPLDYGLKHTPQADSPSIDRIDSNKGYIPGNVWVISWRANSLKNNGELWEFEAIVKAMKRKAKNDAGK
jgi:hypothetical protein